MKENETEKKHYFQGLNDFRRDLWVDFKNEIRKVKTCLEIAAFGAVVTYTVVSCNQWKTAEKQLEATERPWIGVSKIDVYGPLTYTDGKTKAIFQLRYTLKNVGRSPAIVGIYGKIINADERDIREHDWQTEQRNICQPARAEADRSGDKWHPPWVVIPEFPMIYDVPYDGKTPEWDSHIDQPLVIDQQTVKSNGGTFVPKNVGCVLYRSTIDNKTHQTEFSADISMVGPDGHAPPPGGSRRINLRDGDIPAEKLSVIDVLMTGKAD
jgi:hypothetical protein